MYETIIYKFIYPFYVDEQGQSFPFITYGATTYLNDSMQTIYK